MTNAAIDIVVPIHNAADDLARCVESVLRHAEGDYRLLLIDDASTDPGVAAQFAALERRRLPQLRLLASDSNLGFTLTANRGIGHARAGADVVLLNSDAVVTRGWLGKLARCARSDARIGTITPFSNNAEICSLPAFCANNPWPVELDPEPMNRALELAARPSYPDLPTGVGFCLYIRRALIEAIGPFDPAFGMGYGEENDLCMRAAAAGFRNVLCDDAFVLHRGGRSFEGMRPALAERNLPLLLERHPGYVDLVQRYIAADPIAPLRALAMMHYRTLIGPRHGVLHVLDGTAPGDASGSDAELRALIDASSPRFRHFVAMTDGDAWAVVEHLGGDSISRFAFERIPGESWPEFVGGLCARFGIDLVHLWRVASRDEGVAAALAGLDIAFGYSERVVEAQPDRATTDDVEWNLAHCHLLARAAFVLAQGPSASIGEVVKAYEAALKSMPVASTQPAIAAARCLAALRYTPWQPPAAAMPVIKTIVSEPAPASAYGADSPPGSRSTRAGRMLQQLAPKSLRAMMKVRRNG